MCHPVTAHQCVVGAFYQNGAYGAAGPALLRQAAYQALCGLQGAGQCGKHGNNSAAPHGFARHGLVYTVHRNRQHRVCFLCELTHSRAGAENSLCPVAAGDTRILQPPLAHPCYIPTSVHIAQNRVIQNMVHLYFRHLAVYQLA